MPQMKSPHLSHQVGWLRLADINLCPWQATVELSRCKNSRWSLTHESLEPRCRGTDLLRDRISDDGFAQDCDIIRFCPMLVTSEVKDSSFVSTLVIRPGKTECLQCDFAADDGSGLTLSDEKYCCDIAALTHCVQLTWTAHLNNHKAEW